LEGKDLSEVEAQERSLKKSWILINCKLAFQLQKQCFVKVFLVALENNWDEI
jgi:hypothetical protein